jgi:hypothetical protein
VRRARWAQAPTLPVVFRGSIGGYWEAGGRVGGQRTRCPRRCSTIVAARTRAPQESEIPAATQESEEASFFPIVPTTRPMPPPRRMTAVAYHKLRTNLGHGRRTWAAGCSTSGTALNYPTRRAKTPWDADGQRLPRGRELRLRPQPRLQVITTHVQPLAGEPDSRIRPACAALHNCPARVLPGPPRNTANHELQSHDVVSARSVTGAGRHRARRPPGY